MNPDHSTPNDFPKENHHIMTLRRMTEYDFETRKKTIRNAASNFISKPKVREVVFREKGFKCYLCGDPATQIDHKISALRFAMDKRLDIRQLNSFENLFPICAHCNSSKLP